MEIFLDGGQLAKRISKIEERIKQTHVPQNPAHTQRNEEQRFSFPRVNLAISSSQNSTCRFQSVERKKVWKRVPGTRDNLTAHKYHLHTDTKESITHNA
jgi:hypothetical protein